MAMLGALLNGDFKNLVLSKTLEPAVGVEPTKTALQTVAFPPLWLHWLVRAALLPLKQVQCQASFAATTRTRRPFEPDTFRCRD